MITKLFEVDKHVFYLLKEVMKDFINNINGEDQT